MTRFRYSDWQASWGDLFVGLRYPIFAFDNTTDAVVVEVRDDSVVVEYVAHSDLVRLTCPRGGRQAEMILDTVTDACDWWTGCAGLPPCGHAGLRSPRLLDEVARRRAAIEGANGRAFARVRQETDPYPALRRAG